MNTRRYPRSMQEAFPRTSEYADPIERPPQRSGIGWWVAASVIALLALTLIAGRG